jgi:hypothetical protein
MNDSLHDHPIIPPAVPLIGAEGGDVRSHGLGPVLEVVCDEVGCAPPRGSQHVDELEQAH